jgi:hypothetical protein
VFIDAGTNWRDRVNFAEILFDDSVIKKYAETLQSSIKAGAQIRDDAALSREGLRPMILNTKFFPPPDKISQFAQTASAVQFSPLAINCWKFLLKAWYFNTHNMLNGSVSIIGQNNFIGVGENILIPVQALGTQPNFFAGMSLIDPSNAFLLVHVESVTHQFAVNENGARSYITMIQFVRGIFTNAKGELLTPYFYGAIDSNSQLLPPILEQYPNVSHFATPNNPNTGDLG